MRAEGGSFSSAIRQDTELGTEVISLQYVADDPKRSLDVAIAPGLGSNMYRYRIGDTDLIYCDPAALKAGNWTGCFVLWPLPNRVRGKQYEFEGHMQDLHDIKRRSGNEPLIHGLVDELPFTIEKTEADEKGAYSRTSIEVTREGPIYRHFPYLGKLTLDYMLTKQGIRIGYTVNNTGATNMPYGFALHPYFPVHGGSDRTLVTLPANYIMEADEELLPSGELRPMGSRGYDLRQPTPVSALDLDHVFTGLLPDDKPRIDYQDLDMSVVLESSDDFTHMVLYSQEKNPAPGRDTGFICFENQTGSTDMINLHTKAQKTRDETLEAAAHLMIVPPGGSCSGFINYRIEQPGQE